MDHRNITETYVGGGGIRLLLSWHNHTNFVYVQRDQNFFREKWLLSSFIVSVTLDWGANENTEKLLITILTCHALIYGARSVLKTKITLALTTRCQKYRGQFYGKTNESGNKSINKETRQEVDRENLSIQRKYTSEMLLYFRPPSIMRRIIGEITMNSTFSVERLGLTNKNQSYPPTGTHHSPRSVSEWRSTKSSGLLS